MRPRPERVPDQAVAVGFDIREAHAARMAIRAILIHHLLRFLLASSILEPRQVPPDVSGVTKVVAKVMAAG